MSVEVQWFLVSLSGEDYPLPHTMIFLGGEECDVTLQSRSVDKRHAVITYDHYEKHFKVKDLNSANGTYVNDSRIPEQSYVKLEHMDNLRFGYDPTIYRIHRLERLIPSLGLASPLNPSSAGDNGHLPNWSSADPSKIEDFKGCFQSAGHTPCPAMKDLGGDIDSNEPQHHHHQSFAGDAVATTTTTTSSPPIPSPSHLSPPNRLVSPAPPVETEPSAPQPQPQPQSQSQSQPQSRDGGGDDDARVEGGQEPVTGNAPYHSGHPHHHQQLLEYSAENNNNGHLEHHQHHQHHQHHNRDREHCLVQRSASDNSGGAVRESPTASRSSSSSPSSSSSLLLLNVVAGRRTPPPLPVSTLAASAAATATPVGGVGVCGVGVGGIGGIAFGSVLTSGAKHKAESNSNGSLQSAFSGDSLDQLVDGCYGNNNSSIPAAAVALPHPHPPPASVSSSSSSTATSQQQLLRLQQYQYHRYQLISESIDVNDDGRGRREEGDSLCHWRLEEDVVAVNGQTFLPSPSSLKGTAAKVTPIECGGTFTRDSKKKASKASSDSRTAHDTDQYDKSPPVVSPATYPYHDTSPIPHKESPQSESSSTPPSDDPEKQLSKQQQRAGLVTAFTVDFDDAPKPSSKKLDIKDSISKFAPPKPENERPTHRRNQSLSKVDELRPNFKDSRSKTEHNLAEKANVAISPKHNVVVKSRRGYHSEGYFSSDQDDDLSAKSDLLGRKKAKVLEKEVARSGGLVHHFLNFAEKRKSKSKEKDFNSSKAFQHFSKMLSSSGSKRSASETSASTVLQHNSDDVANVVLMDQLNDFERTPHPPTELTKVALVSRPSVLSVTRVVEASSSVVVKVSQQNGKCKSSKSGDRINDDVSESGTYTIEKDSPNSELEEARRNIDRVFGIMVEEEEEAVISSTCDAELHVADASPVCSPASESDKSKANSISIRGTPSWLKDWAAQAAQQKPSPSPDLEDQQAALPLPKVITDGDCSPRKASQAPSKTSVGDVQQRQRRKLPVPPADKAPFVLPSKLGTDKSAAAAVIDKYGSPKKVDRRNVPGVVFDQSSSDASYDTKKLLKETETVVTAMEARIAYESSKRGDNLLSSSVDSGGESDVDTSTASYCTETKTRQEKQLVTKRMNAHLKAKLNLVDDSRKTLTKPIRISNSRAPNGHINVRSRSMSLDHDGSVLSDNFSENETASIGSDISSSSEMSGSSPKTRRKSDKVGPQLKFNRAFSLRRARLGYTSDVSSDKPKIVSKPPTASNSPANPKPRTAEPRRVELSKSKSASSISRNDGGRYSLRVAKNVKAQGAQGSAIKKDGPSKVKLKGTMSSSTTIRSNSTLSSKELELKNWKRRKEYDPMKAAAEGRKKDAAKKVPSGRTPTPPSTSSFQRSASFHSTDVQHHRRNTYNTSEDDAVLSLEDDACIVGSPNRSLVMDADCSYNGYNPENTDVGMSPKRHSSNKKINTSEEYPLDVIRTHSQSDLSSPTFTRSSGANSSYRHKNKLEALDNLAISTVHQLSSKLCGHTELIIKKLRDKHKNDVLRAESIDDALEHLNIPDTPTSPTSRSMSKELAGILKNLRKLEKGLQAIDQVVYSDPESTLENRSSQNDKPVITNEKWNGFEEGEYY